MKKLTISFLIIAIIFSIIKYEVRAEDTIIDVSTQEELADAISNIHSTSNKSYTISINQDITVDDENLFPNKFLIDNGNTVTVLGNGHTIKFFVDKKIYVNNGTINLGNTSGTDILNIEGGGNEHIAYDPLVEVTNGTVNMYKGVSLSNNSGR